MNIEQEQKLIELREQGKTIKEIANELILSISYTNELIGKLIKKGLIRKLSKEEIQKRKPDTTIKVDINKIIELRENGNSFNTIAKIIGVSANLITKRLKPYKIKNPIFNRREKLIELREQGKTRKEIANELKISTDHVNALLGYLIKKRIIKKFSKEEIEKRKSKRKPYKIIDISKAIDLRKKGMSFVNIGKILKVSDTLISNRLKPYSITKPISDLRLKLMTLRFQGLSYTKIAKELKKPSGTVNVLLNKILKKGLIPSKTEFQKIGEETFYCSKNLENITQWRNFIVQQLNANCTEITKSKKEYSFTRILG